MPSYLAGKCRKTGVAVSITLAFAAMPCCVHAQQSGSVAPPPEGPATRGVVILQGEQKPAAKPTLPPILTPAKCERPLRNADINTSRFNNDTVRFDRELSRKLKSATETVLVDISEPWEVQNDAPVMIGRWLEEIKASGGKVTSTEYCQKSRGLFSFIGRLLKRKPLDQFAAVKSYDAALQVNGAEQRVTQILFRRRKPQ